MMHVLLVLSLLGLTTSTIYTLLVVSGALHFARRRRIAESREFTPPVSLLKPLHGSEQGLEVRLESFFRQEYPRFEILFCARSDRDPALSVAMSVAARYPHVPTKFLACGEPPYANAKVWSLEHMQRAAEHKILVISDSDVSVTPDYLRAVVAPFADDRIGLVTCLYRGVALPPTTAKNRSFWSCLEAVGMSVEMSSGVLLAEMLEGMKFALGPTMVVRRDCLDHAGGFAAIGEHHGDDFILGNLVAAHGRKVLLSTHSIEHHILNTSFVSSARHQIRWMRGTRFYRPKGHIGTVLTFSTPYGLLAAVVALSVHRPLLASLLLAWSWATRVALAALVGGLVVREPHLWRNALLYPFRDLLGFFFWSASYLGKQVVWRGEVYELLRGGLMRHKRSPTLPTSPASISPPPPVGSLGLNHPACTDSSQTYGLRT
jgi:ceramide glucosyltransferase